MNKNGRVNETELVMIFEQRGLHVSARDSSLLFQKFDVDNKGYLTKHDFLRELLVRYK